MSENDENERYIDPNSGAAPQPGGFVALGAYSVDPAANEPAAEQPEAEESAQEQPEDSEQSEDSTDDADDAEDTTEGEGDYSELLSQKVPDVQKYLDEHPEELEAVQDAEREAANEAGRDPRKGIVEYDVEA